MKKLFSLLMILAISFSTLLPQVTASTISRKPRIKKASYFKKDGTRDRRFKR